MYPASHPEIWLTKPRETTGQDLLTFQREWVNLIVDHAGGYLLRLKLLLHLALLVLRHASLLLFWAARAILVVRVLGDMCKLGRLCL